MELVDTKLDRPIDPELLARAQADLMPARRAERIERHRKRDLMVTVTDGQGRPVPGAQVSVSQTNHAFWFGCNIFGLNVADGTPDQLAYRQRFTELFNFATLPFYWGGFEKEPGQREYAGREAMARWCQEHRLVTKGHPLIWHEIWPGWAPADPDVAIPLLRDRVADIIERYRGLIDHWDVFNEANIAPHFTDTGVGNWVRRDGAAKAVGTALGWARAARPAGLILYNDYIVGPDNVALIEQLEAAGAMPDAIGIQTHMHQADWSPEKIWTTVLRYEKFNKPIHFTELTVLSGQNRPIPPHGQRGPQDWPGTPEGEAKQAHYLRDIYEILFSHPLLDAITYWDLSDRFAWLTAPSGLLRRDMSPKPAYETLRELIRERWWTRATGAADGHGRFAQRVFCGDYEVTVQAPGGQQSSISLAVPRGGSPVLAAIRL